MALDPNSTRERQDYDERHGGGARLPRGTRGARAERRRQFSARRTSVRFGVTRDSGGGLHTAVPDSRTSTSHAGFTWATGLLNAGSATNQIAAAASPMTSIRSGSAGLLARWLSSDAARLCRPYPCPAADTSQVSAGRPAASCLVQGIGTTAHRTAVPLPRCGGRRTSISQETFDPLDREGRRNPCRRRGRRPGASSRSTLRTNAPIQSALGTGRDPAGREPARALSPQAATPRDTDPLRYRRPSEASSSAAPRSSGMGAAT